MRLLLAAFLLLPVCARAQTKVGAVEAGGTVPGTQSGSLTTGLGAPQPVTLNLASPSLSLTPAVNPSAPVPAAHAAAQPGAAVPALAPSAVAAAAPAAKAPAALSPAAAGDHSAAAAGESVQDPEKAPLFELLDATKRMFGESSQSGRQSAVYLRLDEPFIFGEQETFRYRSALNEYRWRERPEDLEALVTASQNLAESAGIMVERSERAMADGTSSLVLKVVPLKDGHRLNRLAYDLKRSFDADVEYSPKRTRGGVAAYNSADNVLFLPDFGNEKAFEAVLHESRHAAFAKRLRNGDISLFHACLVAYAGRSIAPGAETYDKYMSFEEMSTHAKTLLHAIMRAQSGDANAIHQATSYAFQLMDVLRSGEINLYQLKRMLDKGEVKSERVVSPTFPDFPGGHWESIRLPHSIFAVPVADEGPAPRRSLWDRAFKAKPESAAVKAARRRVELLRPLISATSVELETYLKALRGDEPDLKKARAAASRMIALAKKADEA